MIMERHFIEKEKQFNDKKVTIIFLPIKVHCSHSFFIDFY